MFTRLRLSENASRAIKAPDSEKYLTFLISIFVAGVQHGTVRGVFIHESWRQRRQLTSSYFILALKQYCKNLINGTDEIIAIKIGWADRGASVIVENTRPNSISDWRPLGQKPEVRADAAATFIIDRPTVKQMP